MSPTTEAGGPEPQDDLPLQEVLAWLRSYPERADQGLDLEVSFARAVRQAIDEVIDGGRTGRYAYAQLETQEKAYIGTRIEIVVRTMLDLRRTGKLDTVIAGHEVDFKWSAKGEWMIPREAVGELCIVLSGREADGTFSVGLVRCTDDRLRKKGNQDLKGQLSAAGKNAIQWLIEGGTLRLSFLAELDQPTRDAILAQPDGQSRVRELFMRAPRTPIPRETIPTLAVQEDPMRRVRRDRDGDSLGGMKVLSGHYKVSRDAAEALGYGPLTKRDYLSVPIEELAELQEELRTALKLPPS